MSASSVVWFAFFLTLVSPVIIGIVALLTKEGGTKIATTKSDMPNYKRQHENYWREYLDQ